MGWVEDMLEGAEKIDKDRFLISKPQLDFWTKIMINAKQTQETNIKLNMQIIAQQDTIQRMAEYIAKQDIDEDICKNIDWKTEFGECYTDEGDKVDCVECVIQYFSEVD